VEYPLRPGRHETSVHSSLLLQPSRASVGLKTVCHWRIMLLFASMVERTVIDHDIFYN